jgi:hypothetical protein
MMMVILLSLMLNLLYGQIHIYMKNKLLHYIEIMNFHLIQLTMIRKRKKNHFMDGIDESPAYLHFSSNNAIHFTLFSNFKERKFLFDDPMDIDDNEALHPMVMIMLGSHVINSK